MTNSEIEVAIIGGGAAGIAAGRRLRAAGIDCLVIEARARLGGRAWTMTDASGSALDLGCGWLHSADRNPWVSVAEQQGRNVDRTPPPWMKPALPIRFPLDQQQDFRKAMDALYDRLEAMLATGGDVPAADALEPGGRWNDLLTAVATYISGAELSQMSGRDFINYQDSEVNWSVIEGFGATIAAAGADLRTAFESPVSRIDHGGRRLKIETAKGTITADQAIMTLPTALLADDEHLFSPALPDKTQAARGLPLGLADKLFIALADAEEFEPNSRVFGHTDRVATASYQLRPFGRPMIEAYYGGSHAAALEAEGTHAFFDFALSELAALFGSGFARRVTPIHMHRWGADPFARGSYSYALPGMADCRAALAAPVNDRLFFAGEACSCGDFSTAHGGWFTGVAAADQAIAARQGMQV
ncbi:MAG: NAD(P)/FAD-dependent oxidoreductase [Pseudolabrys sp.]|jgi:monoamine oxidase